MRKLLFILCLICLWVACAKGQKLASHQIEIDTWIQDQTTAPFHYYLMREDKADITLASAIAVSDTFCVVSSGHGFTAAGEYIVVAEGDFVSQVEVKSVSNDTIGVHEPFAIVYTTDAVVVRGVIDMNVDGSASADTFQFNARAGVTPIDIQCVHVTVWNQTLQGDESTFGDQTELTNGLRVFKENSSIFNMGNYRTNADFREYGADVEYNDKAPGGTYGVNMIFNVKPVYGIVLRFDPRLSDKFKAAVRDDLSDLARFRIAVLGQLTLGE